MILNTSTISINTSDKFGRQPIFYAIAKDDTVLCTALIQRGANINSKSATGEPLIIETIRDLHEEAALCLLNNNVEVNVKDTEKR